MLFCKIQFLPHAKNFTLHDPFSRAGSVFFPLSPGALLLLMDVLKQ
jgi:hypothetical protein